MPRKVVTALSVTLCLAWPLSQAWAQISAEKIVMVEQQAASRDGRVHGLVRDDAGRAIVGVSVMAVGPTMLPVMARSNAAGQFSLALPPGEYVLRATRAGYISTYREPVRIRSSTTLERNIVLVREGAAAGMRVLLAATGVPDLGALADPAGPPDPATADHAHSETAWRLRHLAPTALRQTAESPDFRTLSGPFTFKPHPSFVNWMMGESARAAVSFFTNTNFTGQVNFLTTSSLASAGSWLPAELPHGVAYLAVGAPVGSSGDWSLRGAMTATSLASWVVLGEYKAREDQPHAFHAGVSYSSQPSATGDPLTAAGAADRVRSVGGMYAFDRWQLRPALELDYGMRFDRYDYVTPSAFLSPRLGVGLRVLPATRVTVVASEQSVAPGANEFLPPPSAGPWLPPERTFSPLLLNGEFRAERTRNVEVGIEQRLRPGEDGPVVGVRRFRQSARDQIANVFGLDDESDVGHYYVATPGSVDAQGWGLRFSGQFAPRLRGSVDYTTSLATWAGGSDAPLMAMVVPSVVRTRERLHDIAASFDASIPETDTRVAVSVRLNSAFSTRDVSRAPVPAARFDVELRQALPFAPTRASRTELIVVLRNLFRDSIDAGSLYDELLTVTPPMRLMGGVQVRF